MRFLLQGVLFLEYGHLKNLPTVATQHHYIGVHRIDIARIDQDQQEQIVAGTRLNNGYCYITLALQCNIYSMYSNTPITASLSDIFILNLFKYISD